MVGAQEPWCKVVGMNLWKCIIEGSNDYLKVLVIWRSTIVMPRGYVRIETLMVENPS
jgi:hypothetical protein